MSNESIEESLQELVKTLDSMPPEFFQEMDKLALEDPSAGELRNIFNCILKKSKKVTNNDGQ